MGRERGVDAGTIVACAGLDLGKRYPLVIAAHNLYHDYETTRRLGAMGERWSLGATVHAYGAIYGSGAAVVEFGLYTRSR